MNESPCGLGVVLSGCVFSHVWTIKLWTWLSSAAQFLETVGQNITLPLSLHWTTRENNKTTGFHLVAAIFTKAHIQMNALAVKHCLMWLFTKTAQAFQNHNICTVFVFYVGEKTVFEGLPLVESSREDLSVLASVCCKENKWILAMSAWHYLRITVGNTLLPNHVLKEPPR